MVTFICMWGMGSWALIVLVLGRVIGMGEFVCHILWIVTRVGVYVLGRGDMQTHTAHVCRVCVHNIILLQCVALL